MVLLGDERRGRRVERPNDRVDVHRHRGDNLAGQPERRTPLIQAPEEQAELNHWIDLV